MSKLILIPTEFERQKVRAILSNEHPQLARQIELKLCGFGPIAAAAKTMQLLSDQPERVVLLGIAGSYRPDLFPVGSATKFKHVICHGVGVGSDETFISARELGWQQGPAVNDRIACATATTDDPPFDLLTVCSAADTPDQAAIRLAQNPTAVGEDMEAFGVAMACQMQNVDIEVIRGFSNLAGDRNKANWQIDQALTVAVELLVHT